MNIINLFGAPGSGKGTQAKKIAKEFGYRHISTGDMFRRCKNGTDDLSRQVTETINAGNLVSDEILMQMLEKELDALEPCYGIILDGVPRNTKQVTLLDNLLKKFSIESDDVLNIMLTVSDEEAVKRILDRAVIEGRPDDNLETIEKRLAIYKKESAEIATMIEMIEVVGDGKTPDHLYKELEWIIENYFEHSFVDPELEWANSLTKSSTYCFR